MKKIFYLIVLLMIPFLSMGQNTGINIGDRIPEIKGESPNAETLNLTSLRGKLVLVDFWASWCPPCRHENPNLVKAYEKYASSEFKNGNGFEIFSVSLDQRKNDWTKAIERDRLGWPNHICDFKGWYSPICDVFDIQSIPSNLLIDKDGVIIAKNLRGDALELTLKANLK